ncbi:MAG TPA: N-acetylglucosamine-6-phosphate deacetylase [Devosia sp.]|jgi:N-acetylglucosamine-6-phosphate deacetylase|uniref:N-acetylglucosamine-6-phosphate deacetylase n=1 Tax=Devosia sp. TaxID=1871048 RepID=UPI002DDDAA94|nr:N-acetylglucosamine-6-phosphate deacetylase [Devosia sp.]HEV2516483.1 N-acetylglucosamine-6-phosphate deacetylase [Devosia sp.]
MSRTTAYFGARVFDGETWHDDAALVVADGVVQSIGDAPAGATRVPLDGGVLAPGLIDLQVNGGGGHLVGPGTTADDLTMVCATHRAFGVTGLLPTLITDTAVVTDAVLAAGAEAARRRVSGFLGLHLEGPHLSLARKGAHDPALIRPMDEADLVRLERARGALPHLLLTVAAETVTPEQIARLVRAGVVVSIGHSDASFEVTSAAIRAGASMATHLFNAMSQIGNRDPGVVGAALHHGSVWAGLIADGIHVHPATLGLALRAKTGPGRIFLVSDSMSQAGTDLTSFELNGRTIYRKDGALRLGDGTLAGADLTLDAAVRYLHLEFGLELGECLRMASLYPSEAIGAKGSGRLVPGAAADLIWMVEGLTPRALPE